LLVDVVRRHPGRLSDAKPHAEPYVLADNTWPYALADNTWPYALADSISAALGDGSLVNTLQTEHPAAFSSVTVDVAATQAAISDATLEVIVTTPGPTASPTPQPIGAPTVAPTATRGSDTVDAAHRLSGASAALLVLALAA